MTATQRGLSWGINLLSKVSRLSIFHQSSRLSSEDAHKSSNEEVSEGAARKQSGTKGKLSTYALSKEELVQPGEKRKITM